jgi:hypothetical protein
VPGPLVVEAAGAVVAIDTSGLAADDHAAITRAWADAVAHDQLATATDAVTDAVVVATASLPRDAMLADLSQRVTLAAIDAGRGRWMLHAAGVATVDGRVVVFVGPSGRGKTTAARALGTRFGYVSDETVAIDADGRVLPYRKPLSIIEAAGSVKAQRAPGSIGLLPLPDAELRLAAVVLLDRSDDHGDEPVVERVDLGDAIGDLVAQTSYLTELDKPLRSIASQLAAVGGVQRVRYREASSLPAFVPQILEAASRPLAPGAVEQVPDASAVRIMRANAGTRRFSRVRAVDALALKDPDRVIVLHLDDRNQGVVRVLAGIAPEVWRAAAAASVDELSAAAVAAYGEPDGTEAPAAVSAVIDELVGEGLLAPGPLWGIPDDVAWTERGDRVVALRLSDPDVSPQALEGSAALIWLALAEGDADTATVVARVASSAEVEPDEIRADVADFLTELAGRALVRV